MSATFTDDDIEKTVENASGEAIGTVTAVEGVTARVEPRAGIVDSIRARLGWRRGGRNTVVIHETAIDEISSGTIRLEAETEPTAGPTGADSGRGMKSDATEPTGTETGGKTGPRETTEGSNGTETQSSPDAMSGTESAEPSGAVDRGGVQDVPISDTAEPFEERSPETAETDGTEPTDESSADTETEPEETDLVDELDTGSDLESAVDTTESDGSEVESGTGETTETDDITDEIALGTDLESAAETDSRSEPRADTRPETALDPSVDVDSSTAADPRPENGLDSDVGGTAAATGSRDPATEIDPGVDLEAAVDSDRRSEPDIDPETVAGPKTGAESGVDAAAREIVPESAAATDRKTAEGTDERPAAESAGDDTDRGRERRRSSSPLTAVLTAQRAAITQGQAMVQQSLAVQQRAARGAVEFPLLVQRQGLEAMRAAIRNYLDAVTAMETETSASREQRRVLEEAVTELEETHTRLEDEELADGLATHLERLRALQSRFDDRARAGSEQAALLLERQVELLEECQRRLDAAGE